MDPSQLELLGLEAFEVNFFEVKFCLHDHPVGKA